MNTGLDSGPELPARVIDWAWRERAIESMRYWGWSLRDIADTVGCSYEKVRGILFRNGKK